jgi:hypothetical protein
MVVLLQHLLQTLQQLILIQRKAILILPPILETFGHIQQRQLTQALLMLVTLLAQVEYKDSKVFKAIQAHKAVKVLPVQMELMEHKVAKDLQVPKEVKGQ